MDFVLQLGKTYGVGMVSLIQRLAFTDTDLNLNNLLLSITKMVLHRCDKTIVNLDPGKTLKAAKGFSNA